jgi:two-component system CheB/CheR fusion protein
MTLKKKRKAKGAAKKNFAKAQTRAKHKDDARQQPSKENRARYFPVVGIGASAGGLAAFEAFFSNMPNDTDPGMAFVLVQHLAPDHKSILTDLIRRYTQMRVFEVQDGMAVQPNCAYIIPPNRDMAFINGTLQLLEPAAPRGHRLPIDFFFRSLAQDQREHAIGIVLSGTGSDGTQGVRAIKSEGGMVMAQSPASTEYDGMPRSAITTGLVDYELLPAQMPERLIAYVGHAFGKIPKPVFAAATKAESALKKIFVLLRDHTGHDFSQYKLSTVNRRIDRRMAVQELEMLDEYVKYLQRTPAEVEALFRDLLIGVTNFFRDSDAFAALENQVIPKLLAGKETGASIRVWSVGCSTGEEAYSIAILLQERIDALKQHYKVQIFATDIDSNAVAAARIGLYPASIAADVTPMRLARFFTAEPGATSYRINKSIRDLLIFSSQDVIKDPPFSKLDLLVCRNLLIYIDAELQKKLISLFHYALNPGGFLFLGTSETIGEFDDLFSALDRKGKLYMRKDDFHRLKRTTIVHSLPARAMRDPMQKRAAEHKTASAKLPLRELTEQSLLQLFAPTAALVNESGDILYLHGRAGHYLEIPSGESGVNNILKMAREGLRPELAAALRHASTTRKIVRCPNLRVKTNGDFTTVNLTVKPVAGDGAHGEQTTLLLILLEEVPILKVKQARATASSRQRTKSGADAEIESRMTALKDELRTKDAYIQSTHEQMETTNEELKSSNEEMQSVNEELQSTNEELETSKEELQSVNEELATVNTELQTKVSDLSRANNDMNNLLAGTGIGTVFVDHQLRILRFTPAVTQIINLIQSDVGRPVAHIVSNLVQYDQIVADTNIVLNSLIPKEVEVQTQVGNWYSMRILPYRTLDNVIEGAVITFVNITIAKKAEAILKESELRFRQIAEFLPQLVWTCGLDGAYDYVNPQWTEFTGLPEAKLLGSGWLSRIHADDRNAISSWLESKDKGQPFKAKIRLLDRNGEYHWFDMRAKALRDTAGTIVKWFGMNMDIAGKR